MWKGVIREYPDFYHFDNQDHITTLLEGNTPRRYLLLAWQRP